MVHRHRSFRRRSSNFARLYPHPVTQPQKTMTEYTLSTPKDSHGQPLRLFKANEFGAAERAASG
jgi:hypothetical protein